jgi:O-antigen/teichoic acid export membrane protein
MKFIYSLTDQSPNLIMSSEEGEISGHNTARGMLALASKDIIISLSAALFFVFIARFLTEISDLGIVTGLQTIIATFNILSSLGIPPSATRFISMLTGAGENQKAAGLYPLIFSIAVVVSIIFSVITYYLAPSLSTILFHDLKYSTLIELTSIDIFLFSMTTSCIYLLYASNQFMKITWASLVNSVLKFPLALIFLVNGLGLQGIVFALIISDAVSFIIYVYYLRHRIFIKRNVISHSISELKSLIRYSFPIYGSMILNFLSTRLDVYLLLALSSLSVVGVYSPAVFISNTFFLILAAMDQALLPFTSRMFGTSGLDRFKFSSKLLSRYLFLFYFPLGFAIASSAPSLVVVILGDRFYESAYPITIIVIAITLTSMSAVFSNFLRSAGHPGIILKGNLLALVLQISVLLTTIPYFGILGAAAARATSRLVIFVYLARRLDRLNGLEYDRRALVNGLVGSSIISILIIGIDFAVEDRYSLPIAYIVAVLAYLLFLRQTRALEGKDLEFIDKIFLGKLNRLTVLLTKVLVH